MGIVRACHQCREYVRVEETYEGQKILRAFEKDHKVHPVGSVDIAEVRSYADVTAEYL